MREVSHMPVNISTMYEYVCVPMHIHVQMYTNMMDTALRKYTRLYKDDSFPQYFIISNPFYHLKHGNHLTLVNWEIINDITSLSLHF